MNIYRVVTTSLVTGSSDLETNTWCTIDALPSDSAWEPTTLAAQISLGSGPVTPIYPWAPTAIVDFELPEGPI